MENKYYVPNLEEFHVGFEYEVLDQQNKVPVWTKINDYSNAYDYEDSCLYGVIKDLEKGFIRVKYLDKEDIEDCGWKLITKDIREKFNPQEQMKYYFESENHSLSYLNFYVDEIYTNKGLDKIGEQISVVIDSGEGSVTLYLKNKSEFKKIMKQMGIFPKTKFNTPTECQCIRQLGVDEWDKSTCQIHK